MLADYLFSGWGTVTPVRRQDDFGIDLYCTLTERTGQRAVVRDYFVVQVKSTDEPWQFHDRESVKWLVEYPLAFVSRLGGQATWNPAPVPCHTTVPGGRFAPPAGPLGTDDGKRQRRRAYFVQMEGRYRVLHSSAPILRIKIADLLKRRRDATVAQYLH